MVVRPRVIAAPAAKPASEWQWHRVPTKSMSVLALTHGDRRLEAGTYLSEGHSLRQSFVGEGGSVGWQQLGQVANIWQPSRLKGVLVGRQHGTPFLAATQVFDTRPAPRKWLSLDRTDAADARFVASGMILVTRSGSVGRATLAYAAHEKTLISDDLLRVVPNDESQRGWLYALLRSSQGRAMMTGQQYGHMIKHLEPSHLAHLPVPDVTESQSSDFQTRTTEILEHRNRGWKLLGQAEQLYAAAVGPVAFDDIAEQGFRVSVSAFASGRRRLEANYHTPKAAAILKRFAVAGVKIEALGSVTDGVWWMNRFKRNYGPSGMPYLSADELFMLNPEEQKRIIVADGDNHESYLVEPGWLLMACSGQTYGLNGSVCLATEAHSGTFFSHDLIRIRPKKDGPRAGYIATALSHPALGRPLLIREAYGTSIPHLDPNDVAAFPVVRLGKEAEGEIADLAEQAAAERARAEVLERELAEQAEVVISKFLMLPSTPPTPEDVADAAISQLRLAEIDEFPESVLRGSDLEARMARWEA